VEVTEIRSLHPTVYLFVLCGVFRLLQFSHMEYLLKFQGVAKMVIL